MFRLVCIFIQALWIWREQTATDNEKEEEDSGEGLKELSCRIYFCLRRGLIGVIPSLFSLSNSSTSSYSSSSQFWMFSRVWLEGDAPGRCNSDEGCWHRGGVNSGGCQKKSPSPSSSGLVVLQKVDWDLCVCLDAECFLGVGPLGLSTRKPCQKCPRTKMSPGWVLPLWLVDGGVGAELREGGRGGGGGLLLDYKSSFWVLSFFFFISVSFICFGICYLWPQFLGTNLYF